jgi:hypothetical protein
MMPSRPLSAAARTCLALAILLVACAAADPSGLFAPIGWTGRPVAEWGWWVPYVVQAPLALFATFVGARAVSSGPTSSWLHRLVRLWIVVVLAMAAAAVAAGAALLLPLVAHGRYVLPVASSAAFVLWSSGYVAMKMAVLGWLPALAGAWGRRERSMADVVVPASDEASPVVAPWAVGGTVLALALLGPWLASHFWHGSPMGYAYDLDGRVFAPASDAGVGRAVAALALVGLVMWRGMVSRPRPASGAVGLASSAVTASGGAALAIWGVQALLWWRQHPGPSVESWGVPALILRGVDACAFALLCAAIAATLVVAISRLAPAVVRGRPRSRLRAGPQAGPQAGPRTTGLVLVLVALLVGGEQAARYAAMPSTGASPRTAMAPPSAQVDVAMPRVQVVDTTAGPVLADERGARMTLRGVNVNQLGAYQPRDPRLPTVQPLAEQDFADIAALGMNVVRLTLSWSELEPAPGHVSEAYLARIRTALGWAHAHGVHVLLDMHQDAWGMHVGAPPGTACRPGASPMVGWDGAPRWATLDDGADPCQFTGRDIAPNVSRAFQSFYVDRDGIQSRLVQAWRAVAMAFAADPTVAGYDLLNEPNFGESPPLATTLLLANYQARAIEAIRAGERAAPGGFPHPVFVEPSILWSGFGLDNLPPRDFTTDTQVVFSPHLYNESITADQDFGLTLVSIERGVALAAAAGRQLDMPVWIGEWGFFKAPGTPLPGLWRQVRAEDDAHMGSAFWVWKQGCSDPHVYPGQVAGNLRQWRCPAMTDQGTERTLADALDRPYLPTSPDPAAVLRVGPANQLEASGTWMGASVTAATCGLTMWVPGDAAPQARAISGARLDGLVRVAPGQAALGASGGWIVRACLLGGPWHIALAPPAP